MTDSKTGASLDHVTDGTRCWCKQRVAVVFAGEKIGEATLSGTGMVNISISSDLFAKRMELGIVKSLSINVTNKENFDD